MPSYLLYIIIFLSSLSTLAFEITLSRFFSIAQWYHLAFMVVSIALLGIGASGTILMFLPSLLKLPLNQTIPFTTFGLATTTLITYLLANQIPFDMVKLSYDYCQIFYILVYYLLFSIPFFLGGITTALALTHLPTRANQIYAADLFGAGSGCLLALFFHALGGITLCFLNITTLSLMAFFLASTRSIKKGMLVVVVSSLIIYLSLFNPPWFQVKISPYKDLKIALRYPTARHLFTLYSSSYQVDVIKSPAVRYAPGLSLKYFKALPPQLGFTVDASNLNSLTYFQGKREELIFTSYLTSALPYYLRNINSVLILEPQGGLDVLTAYYHNADKIICTEKNPLILELTTQKFSRFTGEIFQRPPVKMIREEGRAYLSQTGENFDLIQYSLTNTLGAASSGIFGLIEDYGLTKEALSIYYNHLKPGGFLSFTLFRIPPPREELRLISTILCVLEEEGIKNPEKYLMAIRSWSTCTLLVKKGLITEIEILRGKKFLKRCNFDWIYYPGVKADETNIYNLQPGFTYYQIFSSLINQKTRKEFIHHYLFDINPAIDDKPFVHYFLRTKKIKEIYLSVNKKWQFLLESGYFIQVAFLQALLFSSLFILIPFLFLQDKEKRKRSPLPILSYFLFIGIGFMFIEIPLIQRFILFLAQPVYALSICLLSLLLSTGVGSLFSKRFLSEGKTQVYLFIFLLLAILIILYAYLLPELFKLLIGLPHRFRQLVSFIIIFPLGFFLGIPFPSGIRLLKNHSPEHIPWAWCINSCASVVSSAGALMIALSGGMKLVMILAALSYFLAFFSLLMFFCFSNHRDKTNAGNLFHL